MKILLFLIVLFGVVFGERNDPPFAPLSPGNSLPGNGPQSLVTVAKCEEKYVRISASSATAGGYLQIEAIQNTTGAADLRVQSGRFPNDQTYEAMASLTAVTQLQTIKSICGFGRSGATDYYVGIKGVGAGLTDVLINATVVSKGVTQIAADGVPTTVSDPQSLRSNTSEVFDFFTVPGLTTGPGSLLVSLTGLEGLGRTFDLFVQDGSQAGPGCAIKSKTSCVSGQADCKVDITPCLFTNTATWFITVRTSPVSPSYVPANVTNGTAAPIFTYSVKALLTSLVPRPIGLNDDFGDTVKPGSFKYYTLGLNSTNTEVNLRVDAILGGTVDVSLDYGVPLGPNCVSASTCQGYGENVNTICTLTIPYCAARVGTYYLVVKGNSGAAEANGEPISYTLNVSTFQPPNTTLTVGLDTDSTRFAVTSKVSTTSYDQYVATIGAYAGDAEFHIKTFVSTDSGDRVTVTASSEAAALCSAASTTIRVPFGSSSTITKSCTTDNTAGQNTCTIAFNTCELRAGNWYIKVAGAVGQLRPIQYTIQAYLVLPRVLTAPYESIQDVATQSIYRHFKFALPASQLAQAVSIELDSVDDGEVEVFARQSFPAGCDDCYNHFEDVHIPAIVPGNSATYPVAAGGPYTNQASIARFGPHLIVASGATYYISVRGRPTAGKAFVKFTLSLKTTAADSTAITVAMPAGPASAPGLPAPTAVVVPASKGTIPTEGLASFSFTPQPLRPIYADVVFNPVSPSGSAPTDNQVYVIVYNTQFDWVEFKKVWTTLPNPAVYAGVTRCILSTTSTTSCSVQITKCSASATGWKVALWPVRAQPTAENVLSVDYTLNVRQDNTNPTPLTLGTALTFSDKTPLGSSEKAVYYYTFPVASVQANQYLRVDLTVANNPGSDITLFVDPAKAAGPAPCDGNKYSCSIGSGVACSVFIEPCDLVAGSWFASIAVAGSDGSRKPIDIVITPSVLTASTLRNGVGETEDATAGAPSHWLLSYPVLNNPGAAIMEVRVTTQNVASYVTVRLNRGSLAGCSSCLAYAATLECTTVNGECDIEIPPCEMVGANWFISIANNGAPGSKAQYNVKATIFDVAPVPAAFGTAIVDTADRFTYKLYQLDVPEASRGTASMSVVINSANGVDPIDIHVFPKQAGSLNPDLMPCTMTQCTNTTVTPCGSINYPASSYATYYIAVRGEGGPNGYSLTADLKALTDLADGTARTSTLKPGAYEAYRFTLPAGAPEAGAYLEVVLSGIESPSLGVKTRLNGDAFVRQTYPSTAGARDFETAASVRRTTPSNVCNAGAPGNRCTIIIQACTFQASTWYLDVEALKQVTNSTTYTITANYRRPIDGDAAPIAYDTLLGDAAYRTIVRTVTAADTYISARVNSSSTAVSTKMGPTVTGPTKCSLTAVPSRQLGPCCLGVGTKVITEVTATPTFNNTFKFDYQLDRDTPTALALGTYLRPAYGVRAGQYRHFTVSVPAPANPADGRFLNVTVEYFTGKLFISSTGYAGSTTDLPCANNGASVVCTAAAACTITLEPCQLSTPSAITIAVSTLATADSIDLAIQANLQTYTALPLVSEVSQNGTLAAGQYQEFSFTVPATLGPMAYLEFSTARPPASVPGAPDGPYVATASTSAIAVTFAWNYPTNDGFDTITKYSVCYAVSSGGGPSGPEICADTATSATTITYSSPAILASTRYIFRVASINTAGRSAYSLWSNEAQTITPVAPSAPGIPSAAFRPDNLDKDTSLVISFSAPLNDGGYPILTYTYGVSRNGGTYLNATSSSAATSITVTGLTFNSSYTFIVRANNLAGSSAFSAASNAFSTSAILSNVTSAPTAVTAVSTDPNFPGFTRVTWTAPADNGGSAITSYSVTYTRTLPGLGAPSGTITNVTGTPTGGTYTFSWNGNLATAAGPVLYPTSTYSFTVVAVNSRGSSASSASSTPLTLPPYPSQGAGRPLEFVSAISVQANAGAGKLRIVWGGLSPTTTIADYQRNGQTNITYLVEWRLESNPSGWNAASTTPNVAADGTVPTCTVDGLTVGASIVVRVTPKSGSLLAASGASFVATTVPAARRRLLATEDSETAAVETTTSDSAVALVSTRHLLGAGDPNLDITKGLFFRVGADVHAGSLSTCKTPTRQVTSACVAPNYCTLVSLCDAPPLVAGSVYKVMLFNPISGPANYDIRMRVQDPAITTLALDTPTSVLLNNQGVAGLTLATPASTTFGFLTVEMTNSTAGTKLSIGTACSQPATCTVAVGQTSCLVQIRPCAVNVPSAFIRVSQTPVVPGFNQHTIRASLDQALSFTDSTPVQMLNLTSVTRTMAAFTTTRTVNAGDVWDITVNNVVNGTVKLEWVPQASTVTAAAGSGVCASSAGSCTASSSTRTKNCRISVPPCVATLGPVTLSFIATIQGSTDGTTATFVITATTRPAYALTYTSPTAGDYLWDGQYNVYTLNYPNITAGDSFLLVSLYKSNVDTDVACTHGVTVGITNAITATSSAACDVSIPGLASQTFLVDTCAFTAGTWYVTARGAAPAGLETPVNFRLSAMTYSIPVVTVPQFTQTFWNPPAGYYGLVEYKFTIDSLLSGASYVTIMLDFDSANGNNRMNMYLARGARIGYKLDLNKSCLSNKNYLYTRSAMNCNGDACRLQISPCELATGDYYVRLETATGTPSNVRFTWFQHDTDAKTILAGPAPNGARSESINVDAVSTYRFQFNSTAANAALSAKITVLQNSGSATAKLYLNRGFPGGGLPGNGACGYTSMCSISGSAGASCVVRAAPGSGSGGSATCTNPNAVAGSLDGLVDTWFLTVVGDVSVGTITYDLEVSQTIAVEPLPIGQTVCPVIQDWDIREYRGSLTGINDLDSSSVSIEASSGAGSFAVSNTAVATECSTSFMGSSEGVCASKPEFFFAALGSKGTDFALTTSIERPSILNLPWGVATTVRFFGNYTTHYAFTVPASVPANALIRVAIAGMGAADRVSINQGFMVVTPICAPSECVGAQCAAGVTLCSPSNTGRYFIRAQANADITPVVSLSFVSRAITDVTAGGAATPDFVDDLTNRVYRLSNVPAGATVSASLAGVNSRDITVSLQKGLPGLVSCSAAAKTLSLGPGTTASGTISTSGLCDTPAGDYYFEVTVKGASSSCLRVDYTISFTVTPSSAVALASGATQAVTVASSTVYAVDLPQGNGNTTAPDVFFTVVVTNPSYPKTVQVTLQRSAGPASATTNAGGCRSLRTEVTPDLITKIDATCTNMYCSYVVEPCDLATGTGPVYVTVNAAGAGASFVASARPLSTFTQLTAGSTPVNSSVLELYAVAPAVTAAGASAAALVTLQSTSGAIRYRVHRVGSCAAAGVRYSTSSQLEPSSGAVSVFEHNVLSGLPFSLMTPTVIIVQAATDNTVAGYTVSAFVGANTCAPYSVPNGFCQIPAGAAVHSVWRTAVQAGKTALRSDRASDLAAFIESRFRCPRSTTCGDCPNTVTDKCRKAIQDYACSDTYRRCDPTTGFQLGLCQQQTCRAVELACGRTFSSVGLAGYACETGNYVRDGANNRAAQCSRWEFIPLAPSPIPTTFPTDAPNSTSPLPAANKKKGVSAAVLGGAIGGSIAAVGLVGGGVFLAKKKSAGGAGTRV